MTVRKRHQSAAFGAVAAGREAGVHSGVPGHDTQAVSTELLKRGAEPAQLCVPGLPTVVKPWKSDCLPRKFVVSEKGMLIWPDFINFDAGVAGGRDCYATVRALGLRAKIDEQTGWHKTLSNVGVSGVNPVCLRMCFWGSGTRQTDAGR